MRKEYKRASLTVSAEQYEMNKGLEDGFELYTKVVTNGWISPDNLVHITRPDGAVVRPYIKNRRGVTFIREGDYVIFDDNNERHVCGADKFPLRYKLLEENTEE